MSILAIKANILYYIFVAGVFSAGYDLSSLAEGVDFEAYAAHCKADNQGPMVGVCF